MTLKSHEDCREIYGKKEEKKKSKLYSLAAKLVPFSPHLAKFHPSVSCECTFMYVPRAPALYNNAQR